MLASPASALTIPSPGLALPNLAFPLGSLAILVLWRRDLGDLLRRHALLLSAVAALLAWTALSTLASMKPETSSPTTVSEYPRATPPARGRRAVAAGVFTACEMLSSAMLASARIIGWTWERRSSR